MQEAPADTARPSPSPPSLLLSSLRLLLSSLKLLLASSMRSLLTSPACVLALTALSLLAPLLFIHRDSAPEVGPLSPIRNTLVACSIALCVPLLMDAGLDQLEGCKGDHSGCTIFSVAALLACSSGALASHSSPLTTSIMCLGLYAQLGVLLVFVGIALPKVYPRAATRASLALLYVFLLAAMLNNLPSCRGDGLYYLCLVAFYSTLALQLLLGVRWISSLMTRVRAAQTPLLTWMRTLSVEETVAIQLLLILMAALLILIVLLNTSCPTFPHLETVSEEALCVIQVLSAFICVGTYVWPSRLLRSNKLMLQQQVENNLYLAKYISHEIRSPLSIIVMGIGLVQTTLEDGKSIKELGQRVSDIRKATLCIEGILDDMLLYEQVNSSSVDVNLASEDPVALLTEIARSYRSEIAVRWLSPAEAPTLSPRLFSLSVDRAMLRVVLNAILLPAVQSTSNGELSLYLSIVGHASSSRSHSTDGPNLILVIRDARSHLDVSKVSEMLSRTRTDFSFKRNAHADGEIGSGLGLGLANKFLLLHGANISVKDAAGVLVYELCFPVQARTAPMDLIQSRDGSIGSRNSNESVGMSAEMPPSTVVSRAVSKRYVPSMSRRVSSSRMVVCSDVGEIVTTPKLPLKVCLIVDESRMFKDAARFMLRSFGYRCHDTSSGTEALEKLAEVVVDAVLIGPKLSQVNGREVVQLIRIDAKYEGFILGVAETLIGVEVLRKNGADDVVVKPLTAAKFETAHAKWKTMLEEKAGRAKIEQPKSVLIADDSALVRRMTMQVVNGLGFRCFQAEDGALAVSKYQALVSEGIELQIILLDNEMPNMKGWQCARVLRDELGYTGVLLGVTGNLLTSDVLQFKECGADGVLGKPLRVSTLKPWVEVAASRARQKLNNLGDYVIPF